MRIRVGSRGSALAVKQTELVMEALRRADAGLELELVTYTTTGDRIQSVSLEKVGGKGLFVRELDKALLGGEVELTAHSLKDLPMELPPELPIAAFLPREEPLDALVLRKGLTTLPARPVFGCAARRRGIQLAELYPGSEVRLVRGNVPTRLARLDAGEYDALVLAVAGLRRLGLEGRISRRFTPQELLPAAGQGIIAVQCRRGEAYPFLRKINDPAAETAALAERAFVRRMGGGCSDPTAAYAALEGDRLTLTGLYVFSGMARRMTLTGWAGEAERLGVTLAQRMLEEYQ